MSRCRYTRSVHRSGIVSLEPILEPEDGPPVCERCGDELSEPEIAEGDDLCEDCRDEP